MMLQRQGVLEGLLRGKVVFSCSNMRISTINSTAATTPVTAELNPAL
jgi:hypothetical protein